MAEENTKKTKLALKSFVLKDENSTQLILAHKQISENEHYVFTRGETEKDKLRCFRLELVEGEHYHAVEVLNLGQMAEVARVMSEAVQENQ